MFWKKSNYVWPDDYGEFIKDLFVVCSLNKQEIEFTEVCNVDKKQVCIKRNARMHKLLSNANGDLYFEGKCAELGRKRIFELVMPEYKIAGKNTKLTKWFLDVTGRSRHMFNTELAKRASTTIWQGKSPVTIYTDVFSVIEDGGSVQKTVKRVVSIVEILLDKNYKFYVRAKEIDNGDTVESYVNGIDFTVGDKNYEFFDWCRAEIKLEPLDYLPEE